MSDGVEDAHSLGIRWCAQRERLGRERTRTLPSSCIISAPALFSSLLCTCTSSSRSHYLTAPAWELENCLVGYDFWHLVVSFGLPVPVAYNNIESSNDPSDFIKSWHPVPMYHQFRIILFVPRQTIFVSNHEAFCYRVLLSCDSQH